VSDFEEFHKSNPGSWWNKDRALFVADRESAFAVSGSIANFLFHYREPILSLRKEDQQLLAVALRGLTDEELSKALSLKVAAVKKRWAAVFGRVSAVKPELIPEVAGSYAMRGRQKRHHLLAYLREHPEELRPVMSTKETRFRRPGR
jgi:hypothetical protein